MDEREKLVRSIKEILRYQKRSGLHQSVSYSIQEEAPSDSEDGSVMGIISGIFGVKTPPRLKGSHYNTHIDVGLAENFKFVSGPKVKIESCLRSPGFLGIGVTNTVVSTQTFDLSMSEDELWQLVDSVFREGVE